MEKYREKKGKQKMDMLKKSNEKNKKEKLFMIE